MSDTPKLELTSQAVNAQLRAIARIPFRDWERLSIEVKNVGANALDGFAVKLVPHENADSYVLADDSTDFATASLIGCIDTAGAVFNPVTMAANAKCMLIVPRNACKYVEVWASSASGASLDIRWSGR